MHERNVHTRKLSKFTLKIVCVDDDEKPFAVSEEIYIFFMLINLWCRRGQVLNFIEFIHGTIMKFN